MSIGTRIKNARLKKGITQKQLAEMLYVDPSLVCRWEKGEKKVPIVTLAQIMEILEIPLD
jgi:transcriptional regulator with XRE-family HTH domain